MKYIFVLFIPLLFLTPYEKGFAIDYKDTIIANENPSQPNSNSNMSRAKLLCAHVDNFDANIANIISKYDLDSDDTLSKTTLLVSKMRSACTVLITNKIENSDANIIITSIVEDLSLLNKGMKVHLKELIDDIKNQHDRYGVVAKKIAHHLDILTLKLEKKIYSNGGQNLSERKKQILYHIARLERASRKLKRFDEFEFYKKSEMQSSLLRIVKDIKKEVQNIRNL